MKQLLTTIAMICVLTGCGQNKNAESERKLAEAQQKLDEATKALEEAKQLTDAKDATASRKLSQARDQVKKSAAEVKTAAQSVKDTTVAAQQSAESAEAARRAAAAAEAKAEEARRLAEPPPTHTIPAGTTISVRTQNAISTKTNESGTLFEANLTAPLEAGGYLVAGKGATVRGLIAESDDGGRVKGKASITVSLKSLVTADGKTLNIETDGVTQVAQSNKKKDAVKVGIASGIGAAIGAIAGGGKGAAIGAGAGAAGGTGVVLGTKGEAAVIPSESVLTFKLAAPVTVQEARR